MSILDTMKQVAGQTQNANVPAAFLFGTVTEISPLTIRVDNRFDISGEAIVLMKEFRGGYCPTHTHTIDPHTHAIPLHSTQPAGEVQHNHNVAALDTQATGLTTNPETCFGLTVCDRVVLLRNYGGQSFLVMGRV